MNQSPRPHTEARTPPEAELIAELQQLTSWHPWLIDDTTSAVLASLSGASPRAEIYDLRADTYTVNGTTKHNNVLGLGRVTHASGSFTYSTATTAAAAA
jgi:hypothetical protein